MKTRYTGFLLALLLNTGLCVPSLMGQADPDNFRIGNYLELLDGDSLKVYLNCLGVISESRCAEFYRTGRLDPDYLNFKGEVRDYSMRGRLLMEAVFENGMMNGTASYYHKNGKLEAAGRYVEGVRTGVWRYYYDNGQPHKVINFVDHYPFVASFYTRSGKARVMHGNGFYKGRFRVSSSCDPYLAKGPLKEGRMDGEWKHYSPDGSLLLSREHYEDGRFLYREEKGMVKSVDQAMIRIQGSCAHEEVYLFESNTGCPGDKGMHFLGYKDDALSAYYFPELIESLDSLAPTSTRPQWVIIGLDVDESGELTGLKVRSSIRDTEFEELIRSVLWEKRTFRSFKLNNRPHDFSYFFSLAFAEGQTVIPTYVRQLMIMRNGI